jgi:hypothetical protein
MECASTSTQSVTQVSSLCPAFVNRWFVSIALMRNADSGIHIESHTCRIFRQSQLKVGHTHHTISKDGWNHPLISSGHVRVKGSGSFRQCRSASKAIVQTKPIPHTRA